MHKSIHIRCLISVFITITVLAACQQKADNGTSKMRPDVKAAIVIYNEKLDNGRGNAAIKYLDSAYAKFENLGALDRWNIYWIESNYYLNYDNNIAKASLYADSLDFILERLSEKRTEEYAKTIFTRGNVLLAQKKYNEAFKNFYDGRQYALQHIDKCKLSNFTSELANIKLKQEKYAEAAKYYKLALKEIQDCDTTNNFEYQFVYVQSKINAIAMVYELMGKTDSAIVYYKKTIDFIQKAKPNNEKDKIFAQRALGVVYGNLGGAYRVKRDYRNAEDMLLKSIAINDRPGYEVQDAMTAKIKLAKVYLQMNRPSSAYDILKNVQLQLSNFNGDQNHNIVVKIGLYRLLSEYHDQVGEIKGAYKAQTSYHRLKDSIANVNKGLKAIDMDMAFELNDQKYKSAILQKESQLKTAYLVAFGILILGAAFSLLFFWRDMKKSRSYITRLKKLNTQNQQTLAALEQSQAENDKILRIVAHDLRNPLSGITGVVALMLEEEGFSEETREELALIKATGENSLGLVNELLQVNFNLEDLTMDEVDMGELVQYCAELLRHKATEKNQKITDHGFPIIVTANREKIWRVLSNLIGNAIKFSPRDSSIKVTMQKKEHELVVSVSDNGIGIPHQMADKLFDMFTAAKRDGTAGEQSFGMGLSISKQIIEAHGGKLWFESKVEKGTTFHFSLPI
ncbi:MAG: sensor histidine kinase [Pedobacter sp.]|nr:MAG: sensor histidine kinase [Pedobacter sp.]